MKPNESIHTLEHAPVLVVDDDRDVRETIAAVLEDRGYAVQVAENGAEALAVLHRERMEAVLLDLSMPVMTGWQLIDAVQGDRELSLTPMIVLSSMRAPNACSRVVQLVKPVSVDDLVSTLDRVCRH